MDPVGGGQIDSPDMTTASRLVQRALHKLGFDPVGAQSLPPDLSSEDRRIIDRVRPYTMTSVERILSLIHAVRYVVRTGVPGSVVECGVWRGGSMMAAALTLLRETDVRRDLYLYDTYEGMSEPTADDQTYDRQSAARLLETTPRGRGLWCESPLEDVKRNLESTGYPSERLHYVRGKVEDTIPGTLPGVTAILRLDTDWYESTQHELEHLYPLLARRGILIVDDYGHWLGARRAMDEYVAAHRLPLYLHRIDYTGRLAVKIDGPTQQAEVTLAETESPGDHE